MSNKAEKILAFLKKTKRNDLTYGQLAKKFDSAPMAVGQMLKGIANSGNKRVTRKVKAAA